MYQSSPCTCLASRGDEMIVSAGEDGRINVITLDQRQPVRTIGNEFERGRLSGK